MMPPYYAKTPYQGVVSLLGEEKVKYSQGVYAHKALPLMNDVLKTKDGKQGYIFKAYNDPPEVKDRQHIEELNLTTTNLFFADYVQPKLKSDLWWATVEAEFVPEVDGEYEFGVAVYGTAKLYIDGKVVVDNETTQRAGSSFAGDGSVEEIESIDLKAGQKYEILIEFASAPAFKVIREGTAAFGGGGVRVGMALKIDTQKAIDAAVELAKSSDQVVVCAGLNSDWESEGYDRPHMDLPDNSDDLIAAVVKANPNAVVVIQSGTPVTMPWLDETSALVHAWYGGNETGTSIADVLFGEVNPSAKLSLSFPVRNEDNPAFLNYRSERGRAIYGEDVYIGYRFYEATKKNVAFPFGHGLSYTSFGLSNMSVQTDQKTITVELDVENTGDRAGAEVVQVYVAQKQPSLGRPPKELKGFTKIFLEPGKKERVKVEVDFNYATSFWDEERDSWASEKGAYEVLAGNSSANVSLKGEFEAEQTTFWKGV
jgi:beta-glucosidase